MPAAVGRIQHQYIFTCQKLQRLCWSLVLPTLHPCYSRCWVLLLLSWLILVHFPTQPLLLTHVCIAHGMCLPWITWINKSCCIWCPNENCEHVCVRERERWTHTERERERDGDREGDKTTQNLPSNHAMCLVQHIATYFLSQAFQHAKPVPLSDRFWGGEDNFVWSKLNIWKANNI